MQESLPKKSLFGLALGVALTPGAQAAENAAAEAGGLIVQLVFLPTGLLLAALIIEITARVQGSKSLHGGALALLAATAASAILALIISSTAGSSLRPLGASPFVSQGSGIAFTALSLLAFLCKAISLRLKPNPTHSGEPARAKRRGRGRGRRRRAASRGIATGAVISIASQSAYAVCLAATLIVLVAGSLNREPGRGEAPATSGPPSSGPVPAQDRELLEEPAAPATVPPSPDTATIAEAGEQPLDAEPESPPPPLIPTQAAAAAMPDQDQTAEIATAASATEAPAPDPAVHQPPPTEVVERGSQPAAADTSPQLPPPAVKPVNSQHGGLAGAETYRQLIQPILRSRCYDCHGEEKQKGDLRLDTPEHIRLGGKSGPAIIAGNPEESYLFELISLDESDDDIMPPKGKPLSAAQISWIGGWIREGAALGDGVAWPTAEGASGGKTAADLISAGIASADQRAVQALLDGGVIVRQLSENGALLEIDYSHADRAKGDLRLGELEPIAHNIHTLDLKRTKITDGDLAVLAQMSNLRQLHAQRTGITDAALPHLMGLEHLESLNLYSTQVSDAGLPTLKQLTSLKKLYLWSSKVTADGARELASALGPDVVNMGE